MKNLISRYTLTLILTVFHNIFYIIFTPLTIFPIYFILKIFPETSLTDATIIFNSHSFTFIPACIAGTAYLILTILTLTSVTNIKKAIKTLTTAYLLLLTSNIIRILILIFTYNQFGKETFDAIHMVFWHILSTIIVLIIWIFVTKVYRIKSIPIYTDIKDLIKSF